MEKEYDDGTFEEEISTVVEEPEAGKKEEVDDSDDKSGKPHLTTAEASSLLKRITPLNEKISYDILRLEGLQLLAVELADEDDRDERCYYITKPIDSFFWKENGGRPYCPKCYERLKQQAEAEGRSYTPSELMAQCGERVGNGVKVREAKDFPVRDHLSVITIIHNEYECGGTYVDEHGKTVKCGFHYTISYPFLKKKQQFTDRYVRAIGMASMTKKTFAQVAYDYHVAGNTVIKYFEEEVLRRKAECKFETPEHIGIDEAKVHTKEPGGAFYVCVMNTDPDTPEKNGIIEMEKTSRRTADDIIKIFERFEHPENIKTISMDMCDAYRVAAEDVFQAGKEGHARIIVDRFHLVQSLNDKVKEVVKALYKTYVDLLESNIGSGDEEYTDVSFTLSAQDMLSDDEIDHLDSIVQETMDTPFELKEPTGMTIRKKWTITRKDAKKVGSADAKELLKILKNGYNHKWFVMNPKDLKKQSQAKFFMLLQTFPEFMTVYQIKEMLRWNFFEAETKGQARAISESAEKMLPHVKEYRPLDAYFERLNNSLWTRHIYSYFEDPKGHRHSNAKLERLNHIVKQLNGLGNNMTWPRLQKKVVYGDLSVRRPEPKHTRKKKLEAAKTMYMSMIGSNVLLDDEVQPLLPGMPPQSEFLSDVKLPMAPEEEADMQPSKEYWECIFYIPAIANDKRLAFMDGMTLDEKIHAVESNSNISAIIAIHLERYIRSDGAGDEEYSEKQEIIHPLTFDDWDAHEDFYMGILKEDAKALERYDAGEGEEE